MHIKIQLCSLTAERGDLLKFFILSSFLTLKKQLRVWLSFIVAVIASVGIAVVTAYMVNAYLNEGLLAGKLKLGLVNNDTHQYAQNAVNLIFSGVNSDDEYVSFELIDSEEQMLKDLENGDIFGAIVIPKNFVNSILSGENNPPKIISDPRNPLYALMLEQLANSLTDVLSIAQSGIYSAIDMHSELSGNNKNISTGDLLNINSRFMLVSLSRLNMFVGNPLTAVGEVSVVWHYMVMVGMFFLMLVSAVIAPVFKLDDNAVSLIDLNRLGYLNTVLLSRVATGILPYLMLSAVVVPALSNGNSVQKMVIVLAVSLILYAIPLFIYTVSGSTAHTTSIIFILSLYSLFVGGGILPSVFLPNAINAQKILSPLYYISQLMASGSTAFALLAIFIGLGLITISIIITKNRLRR